MSGWYELSKTRNGQFHFVLKAANGKTILSSETYTSADSAKNGIASVQTNSPNAERYEKRESGNDKHYFLLKAANHQVIGNSEMYESASARDQGISAVQSNGATNTIKDNT